MTRIALTTCFTAGLLLAAAQDRPAPDKLVFPSKTGDITFDHAAHAKRENGVCTSCHDKLWPQSTKILLKTGDGCRTCHTAGGKAFQMPGNCGRCHQGADQR